MAIVKNNFRVSRLDSDLSPSSQRTLSSAEGDDDAIRIASGESGGSDASSLPCTATGSGELEPSEPGFAGTELCQVGNEVCALPVELYDLPDLGSILSVSTWNECLSEEERFALAEFLPDMDLETFSQTLRELFAGKNFHFGSPLNTFYDRLKGGLYSPKIVTYRRGLNFFHRCKHYHFLRKYHNSMVGRLNQMRDVWQNCEDYSIEERLRRLNIVKSQRSLDRERNEYAESETDTESRHSGDGYKIERRPSYDTAFAEKKKKKFGKENSKGVLKVAKLKNSSQTGVSRTDKAAEYYLDERGYEISMQKKREGLLKPGKKQKLRRRYEEGMFDDNEYLDGYGGSPYYQGNGSSADQLVTIASYDPKSFDAYNKKTSYLKRFQHNVMQEEAIPFVQDARFDDWNIRGKKKKNGHDSKVKSSKNIPVQMDDLSCSYDHRARTSEGKIRGDDYRYGVMGTEFAKDATLFDQSEETESDESERVEEGGDKISQFKAVNPIYDSKKANRLRKTDKRGYASVAPDVEPYSTKGKHKGTMNEPNYMNEVKLMKKGHALQTSENFRPSLVKSYKMGRKQKGVVDLDAPLQQANYMPENGSPMVEERNESICDRSTMPLLGCNSVMKKPKGKTDSMHPDELAESFHFESSPQRQLDGPIITKKKGKRKAETVMESPALVVPDMTVPQNSTVDVETEKPQKNPFTLIMPTIHTGFSFSIIHLLLAVRKAMITQNDDTTAIQSKMVQVSNGINSLPPLTVQEIVNRVRSNPGDPSILETQEPIQDLVRGVLKIFSSKTAPLGAKGWKPLVVYEKSSKGWSWVGPLTPSHDNDIIEEETSEEAWGIPHKMLVKLVDAFANWLKSGQETLQQIGSLPAPPVSMLSNLDEKERFKDLRAQKSLNTISPSTDEVRTYFRREEYLRYSIPDRAFAYTAADGRKSVVAPLRRGGGKPTSKARDHYMLKPDRPPHVTVLCLVRDAAARLPGSIGTRADVCTLIRDSQYIVENVTDAQVNQVVSGALDRLHYERDPCVQFDSDRKLWVYLHRDREEEDFEDDGTSSTKKWKRQKKDAPDITEGGSPAGYDYEADLNADPPSLRGEGPELVYNDNDMRSANNLSDDNLASWKALQSNPSRESKMACQDNSNKDFDDEAFRGRGQLGFLSTSLS
ncbi:Nuclear factor [Ananas comosus]|uniref:Nuclear factor n=1 Tax=Ananas comosus TaxID=4615 RepID=A0A199W9F9_ANACO|nr:Nuclear factor [Ananas comosus]